MIRLLGYLILFVFLCVSSISCADNQKKKKENLEMQVMCSKGSKDFFNKNYPESLFVDPEEVSKGYTNHYDSKLNKCFIRIFTARFSGPVGSRTLSEVTSLYDVYEDKEYATLRSYLNQGNNTPYYCKVLGKDCNEKDFQNLIKLYMEE